MSKDIKLHTGTARDMGQRFISAWRRAERGEEVDESHLTFLDLKTLLATLTGKRLELLRCLRQHGELSVKALADALKRNYKNVYMDMLALEKSGLIVREGYKIKVPWKEVQASIVL